MNNKNDQEIKTLNQHSALVTHNLRQGKYYKLNVEKSIFMLLLKSQELLKETFKKIYLTETSVIFKNNEAKLYLENFFNREKFETNNYDKNELIEKINLINKEKIEYINKQSFDEKERKKFIKTLKIQDPIEKDSDISKEDFQVYLNEIKDYCKKLTIQEHIDSKIINFTILSNSIGAHSTTLKKELKNAVNTVLEFNYINKKNINIDIVTSLLASVKFIQDKGTTWLEYQIPKEILNLLLIPEFYVPLEGVVIGKLNGTYTIRMYSLLKDHIKRGEIELTKEELFNFFGLPKSYENKTNLIKKFLEPTLEEVKVASGIETKYEFFPSHKYERIKFYHKKIKEIKEDALPIIEKDAKNTHDFSEKVLKYLEKAKRNLYVNKVWNKRVENKLKKIYIENGETVTVYVLQALYTGVKTDIKISLIKYIEGVIKIYFKENKSIDNNVKLENVKKVKEKVEKNNTEGVITKKTVISFEEYNKKLQEYLDNGMSYDLALRFINIRFIVEED